MKKIFSKKLILFFLIIPSVVLLHYLSILKPIETSIKYIFRPLQNGFSGLAYYLGDQISIITNQYDYQQINQDLRQQVIDLWQTNGQLKLLSEENKILKTELEYTTQNPQYTFITAKVIVQSPSLNPSQITINMGENQQVSAGLPVLVNQGVLIGRISHVDKNTSQVVLLSNNQSKVAASFIGLENSQGIIVGQHNISIQMELIPTDILIEENSLVITSGVQKEIPAGFLIGKIQKINRTPNDLFQTATIEPLVNYNNLKYVNIPIIQPTPTNTQPQ